MSTAKTSRLFTSPTFDTDLSHNTRPISTDARRRR